MFKKLTAAVIAVMLCALAFTGCGKQYESVVTVDGRQITPGEYLYAQYQAYLGAQNEVEDKKNVLGGTIGDISAEEWIHNKTIQNLKSHVWAEKTAKEMGITISEEELEEMYAQAEYYWPFYQEAFEPNGIGLESYKKFLVSSTYMDKIFAKLYTDGGEKVPSDEEFNTFIDKNYARVEGFYLTKKDADGNLLSAENITAITAMAEEAVRKLNEGASYDEIQVEYMTKAGETAGLDKDYSDAAANKTRLLVNAASVQTYDKLFVEKAMGLSINSEYVYSDMEDKIFVYRRAEAYASDDEFASLKDTVIGQMKSDEFTDYIHQQSESFTVEENSEAVKYYSPSKIK